MFAAYLDAPLLYFQLRLPPGHLVEPDHFAGPPHRCRHDIRASKLALGARGSSRALCYPEPSTRDLRLNRHSPTTGRKRRSSPLRRQISIYGERRLVWQNGIETIPDRCFIRARSCFDQGRTPGFGVAGKCVVEVLSTRCLFSSSNLSSSETLATPRQVRRATDRPHSTPQPRVCFPPQKRKPNFHPPGGGLKSK